MSSRAWLHNTVVVGFFFFLSLGSATSSLPSLGGLDMPSVSSNASVSLELRYHVEANDL